MPTVHKDVGGVAAPGARALRADAEANRQRILAGARQVFLESGLDAPVQAVARRSGVSTATLYRRFPTRDDLVTEVFMQEVLDCVDAVLVAARDPDAWRGFCAVVEELLALDAVNRGLIRGFLSSRSRQVDVGGVRQEAEEAFADLVRRAKQQGQLSADFTRADLDLVLTANAGFGRWDPATRQAASRRFAELAVRAFRARP